MFLSDRRASATTVRPFVTSDYEAIVSIWNRVWPDFPSTVEEFRHRDQAREPKIKWGRFLAEHDGLLIGVGRYGQKSGMYHPDKFEIDINVLPDYTGRGIGGALFRTIMSDLQMHQATSIRCQGREDLIPGITFLKNRGFVEEMREWESRLQLDSFDPERFGDAKTRVAEQGIVIKSYAELANDPERARKLYELDWIIDQDIPAPDDHTKPTFKHFEKHVLQSPNFLPEGWFIAIDGDQFVGESALWKNMANAELNVGATGVLREYRRRGIALAMKLHAIEYAKAIGCPEMKTWNEQNNVGMLSINVALGFVRQPAWIGFVKTIAAA